MEHLHRFIKEAAVLACVILAASAVGAQTETAIGFVQNGRLSIQGAAGGAIRPASGSEKVQWGKRPASVAALSPDKRYAVTIATDHNDEPTVLRIVRSRGNAKVYEIESGGISSLVFDGWLPDSQSIGLIEIGHIAGRDEISRGTYNVVTKRWNKFGGWLSASGTIGIVPGKAGRVSEVDERGTGSNGEDEWSRDPETPFYVVPVPRNLAAYRFSAATAKPLTLGGKPFRGLRNLTPPVKTEGYMPTLAKMPAVEFSRDNRWAICHVEKSVQVSAANYQTVQVDYAVDLRTGKVRKLPGTSAFFVHSAR